MKIFIYTIISIFLFILAINFLTIYSIISLVVLVFASFFILKNYLNVETTALTIIKLFIFLWISYVALVNFEWISSNLFKMDLSDIYPKELKSNIEIFSYYTKISFIEESYKLITAIILLVIFYNWFKIINLKNLYAVMFISLLSFSFIENTLYFESFNVNKLGGESIVNSLDLINEEKKEKSTFEDKFMEYKLLKRGELKEQGLKDHEIEKELSLITEEEYKQEFKVKSFLLFLTRSFFSLSSHFISSFFVITGCYFLLTYFKNITNLNKLFKGLVFIWFWIIAHLMYDSLLTIETVYSWILLFWFLIFWIISLNYFNYLKEESLNY